MGIVRLNINQYEVAEEVWALQHAAYQVEAAVIGFTGLPPLLDTVESIRTCEETFWGFHSEDGELIGAISFEWEREARYTLCRLMVHPDYLRQGIGGLLVKHMISDLPMSSQCSVTAEIRNLPAISLYERYGFKRKDVFQPIAEITMLRLERRVEQLEDS